MSLAEPLWVVVNGSGARTACYVQSTPKGYLLLVERDGVATVTEIFKDPQTPLDRAGGMFWDLLKQGWRSVAET